MEMQNSSGYLERTERLLGRESVALLGHKKITIVGLGGVGGTCAEALARSGIGRLHLIDFDTVSPSNLNRQLLATKETIGKKKTVAALARLQLVSDAELTACDARITGENADMLVPADTDLIVDAIDDIPAKLSLILLANRRGIPILSCLGAGNRLDAAAFFVTDIFKTEGDPLARRLRQLLRKAGISSLPVVCSRELPKKNGEPGPVGSFAPVTGAAGLCAAAAAIKMLI